MSSESTKKLTRKEKKKKIAALKTDVTENLVTVKGDPEAKKIGHDNLLPIMQRIPTMEQTLNSLGQYYLFNKHSPHTADIKRLQGEADTGYKDYMSKSQEKKKERDKAAGQQPGHDQADAQGRADKQSEARIHGEAISTGRTAAPRENRPTAPQGGSAPTYFQPNWGVANHIVNNRGISPIQEQAYPNSTTSQGEIAPNTHPGHYRPNRAASGLPPYQIQPDQSLSASQGPINNDYLAYNQPAQAISSNDTPGRLAGRVPIQNPAYARAIGQGRTTRNDIPGSHSTPRGVPSPTPSVALRRLSTPGPELTPLPPPPRSRYVNLPATQSSMADASGPSNANYSLQRSNTFGSVRYSTTSEGSDPLYQTRFSVQSEGSSTEWQRYSQASGPVDSYRSHDSLSERSGEDLEESEEGHQ